MNDSFNFEIEYLDEDADVVQYCISPYNQNDTNELLKPVAEMEVTVLVEGEATRAKKRKIKSSRKSDYVDKDYDPLVDEKEYEHRSRKKVYAPKVTMNTKKDVKKPKRVAVLPRVQCYENKKIDVLISNEDAMCIPKDPLCIPDFKNSLCLPVLLTTKDNLNINRLKTWNKQCAEVYKNQNKVLIFKPSSNEVNSQSKQLTILRKQVLDKTTGKFFSLNYSQSCS